MGRVPRPRWLAAAVLPLPILLLCVQVSAKHSGGDYLYNVMPPEDSTPIIDYIPPQDNYTKNNQGGSELEHPDFLYSTTGPAAVARVVEFYA